MNAELVKLLDKFANLNVVVIGEAILDCYLEGVSDRLCPEAPVPVVNVSNRLNVAGGAANAAANVASLGGNVTFLSVVGDDVEAELLRQSLLKCGVSPKHLLTQSGRKTLTKQRVMSESQILLRFDSGSTDAIDTSIEQALIDELEAVFPTCDAAIVSDYGYGILTDRVINAIAKYQQIYPRILVVDSKNLAAYRHLEVTAVKPNYEQATRLLEIPCFPKGSKEGKNRVEQITLYEEKLLNLTGAKIVAVTLDAEGAVIFESGNLPYRVGGGVGNGEWGVGDFTYTQPAIQSRTIGAGDTYTSALTLALTAGATAQKAADFAAAAAAVVVSQDGTTACNKEQLRKLGIGKEENTITPPTPHSPLPTPQKHIFNTNQLISVVSSYRQAGRTIVFTNGCFDILHAGHVSYLQNAKALGDILIIGVNSDDSICRLKGINRPINPLSDRIQVLGALLCVDRIIAFDEDNPSHLIRIISPDIYVKGGDYTRETLPEASLVEELGGVVQLLPFVENLSTTRIIERIHLTLLGAKAQSYD